MAALDRTLINILTACVVMHQPVYGHGSSQAASHLATLAHRQKIRFAERKVELGTRCNAAEQCVVGLGLVDGTGAVACTRDRRVRCAKAAGPRVSILVSMGRRKFRTSQATTSNICTNGTVQILLE